jgi:cytochrome d ubiquinol oxidase subunit I
MQTPVGFEMRDGQAHAIDWWAILFNPSMPYRLTHMLIASGLTVSFLIAGLSAYRWLRGDRGAGVMAALKTGVVVAAILIPIQIFVGDLHGLNTLKHQPAKIAAMEAIWETERGAPLLLFAWPDEEARTNHATIGIPKGASLILAHEADAEIKGLNDFIGAHPPVKPLFLGFRLMVGVGMLMLLTSWVAAWQLRRGSAPKDWMARVLVGMTFSGWIATLAGWYVTEIGRQPYLVYGVLKTADAASAVPAPMIGATLVMYLALYVVLTISYVSVLFYLARRAGEDDKRHAPVAMPVPGTAE